jgi:DNA-binding XRE family transcriptional regulator
MEASAPSSRRAYAERTYKTYKYRLSYKNDNDDTVNRLFMNRKDLADFVGISTNTVCRWLNGSTDMKLLTKYSLERVRIPAKIHIDRTCVEKSATPTGYTNPDELPPPAV